MSEFAGSVPGATAAERAVRLAGALAELGVARLVLATSETEEELAACETDLPGRLREAEGTEVWVRAPQIGARFRVSPEAVRWEAETEDARAALVKAFAARGGERV